MVIRNIFAKISGFSIARVLVSYKILTFCCFSGKSHKHHETSKNLPKEKPKVKPHAHKSEHQKTKSEHEHAKQTLKLLTDRREKLNTPISVRLKQQVQQHVGNQKHILPVVPKKGPSRPLKAANKPRAHPQIKSLGNQGFAKQASAHRPMQKIRIVYVPTNQSAASLINQGPVKPFYRKPIGATPFVENNPKSAGSFQPRVASGTNLPQAFVARTNSKTAAQQLRGGASNGHYVSKPIDAVKIFNEFPQLRANGVTTAILNDLSKRVPNLEQRIQAHFKSHPVKPALYANSIHHDLAASNLAFMKNFHEALESQKPHQVVNTLTNNMNVEKGLRNIGFSNADSRLAIGQEETVKPYAQETVDRLQTLALQNFQNTFMGKAKPQNVPTNLQNADQTTNYKTPSDLSLQRFRQENVPEVAYRSGNFDRQTNRPGLVFLPGDQISAYSYNGSTSRGILPQTVRYPWQQNRVASFYSSSQYRNTWTGFTGCSSTCGRGMKKRYRKCEIPDCPSGGIEIETVPCITRPCAGTFE